VRRRRANEGGCEKEEVVEVARGEVWDKEERRKEEASWEEGMRTNN